MESTRLLDLNEHCLEHIFCLLDTVDQLNIGLLSPRFKFIIDRLIAKKIFNFNYIYSRLPPTKAAEIFTEYGPAIKKIYMPFPIFDEVSGLSYLVPQNCYNITEVHFNFPFYVNYKIMKLVFMAARGIKIVHCHGRELFDHHCRLISTLPEIEVLNIEQNGDITGLHLDKLKKLKVLNIRGCDNFEPRNLMHICRATKLRSLNIAECNQFDESVFQVIIETQNEMEDLIISHCYENGDIDTLACLPKLRSVCIIWHCQKPHKSTNFLGVLATQHAESIRKLDIYRSKFGKKYEHDGILDLKQLHQVSIISDADLSDRVLLDICRNCSKLQEVNISGCRNVTEEAIGQLVKTVQDLRVLDLRHCRQFSNSLYEHLVKAKKTSVNSSRLKVYVWDSKMEETITVSILI